MSKYFTNIEEREFVESKYKSLLRLCRQNFTKEEVGDIKKAYEFCVEHHKDHRKKSGEIRLVHSIEVANLCIVELSLGSVSIISALLHNIILDHQEVELPLIEKEFGKHVGLIVSGLTRLGSVSGHSDISQSENFRKLLLSLASDVRVLLIKLADRLHNMRFLSKLSRESQIHISNETLQLYSPTAHRLGLYKMKTEMEDLSLKYIRPDEYYHISQKIQETDNKRKKFISEFTKPIKKDLLAAGLEFTVKGRPKSIYSIWNKMTKQGVPFEEVYDQFAIRIILNSKPENEKAECWRVYSVVASHYQPNPQRMRDWISVPKTNGYESLHTTVVVPGGRWVEVQIRTERMDEVAEKGFAAHWKYKGVESDQGLEEWLAKVREILENSNMDPDDMVDEFKLNLYKDEVFVFTPKGDLRRLRAGATLLDFAFDIHSDIGSTCIGGKVNGKNVPIRQELTNGCKVEIITSKTQKPKQEWLEFVKTSKAKSKIKQLLKEEEFKEAEAGKEILQRRLRNWKLNHDERVVTDIVKHFKFKTATDLYFQIALEKFDIFQIKEYLQDKDKVEEPARPEPATTKKHIQKESGENYMIIDNTEGKVDYKLAKCCHPISGDEVFGFVTINDGVKIHRIDCPNALDMTSKYPYRIVKVQWKRSDGFMTYEAALKIIGADEFDMIARISELISNDLKVTLKSISAETDSGLFEGIIKVKVMDKSHLNVLTHKLAKLKGVSNVVRHSFMAGEG